MLADPSGMTLSLHWPLSDWQIRRLCQLIWGLSLPLRRGKKAAKAEAMVAMEEVPVGPKRYRIAPRDSWNLVFSIVTDFGFRRGV